MTRARGAGCVRPASAQLRRVGQEPAGCRVDGTAGATAGCRAGDNSAGQSTVPAGLSDVVWLTAGSMHTCATKNDNSSTCWGARPRFAWMLPCACSSHRIQAAGRATRVRAARPHCRRRLLRPSHRACRPVGCHRRGPVGLAELLQLRPQDGRDAPVLRCGCARFASLAARASRAPLLGPVEKVRAPRPVRCRAGSNNFGQTNVPSGFWPVVDVARVATGANHACARRFDGSVSCWGARFGAVCYGGWCAVRRPRLQSWLCAARHAALAAAWRPAVAATSAAAGAAAGAAA